MALTKEQIQELRKKYNIDAFDAPTKATATYGAQKSFTGTARDFIGETILDIKETGSAIKETFTNTVDKLKEARQAKDRGEQGGAETVFQMTGALGKGIVDAGSEAIIGAGKTLTNQKTEDKISDTVSTVTEPIVNSDIVRGIVDRYESLDERTKRNLDAILGIGSLATSFSGAGLGAKGVTKAAKFGKEIAEQGLDATKKGFSIGKDRAKNTLFGNPQEISNVDDVIRQADETLNPSQIRNVAEQSSLQPNLKERWAGITPDIKNRIAGKQDKLKEYFDVAHARNNFDTLPTPLEYATKNVDTAVIEMERLLNDTGGDIGKFRKTIGSYEAPIDSVRKIEQAYLNELKKLNLEIRNGKILQRAGGVTRVSAPGEIKVLNEIYNDLKTVKENPNLEKIIDLRNVFDNKINFGKSAREVGNTLDPLSRNLRKQVADVASEIVGKEQAGNLKVYSEFMDAYNELRGYTDRNAGGEFLLKRVLSERGGDPRKVIQTIKDITGIDLMDDAVMARLATDLIGNSSQKGLFRQELTKAGLDAVAILGGDRGKAFDAFIQGGKKLLVNEEKTFLKAAGNNSKLPKPKFFGDFKKNDQEFITAYLNRIDNKGNITPKITARVKEILKSYGYNTPTNDKALAEFLKNVKESGEKEFMWRGMDTNVMKSSF